MTKKKDKHKPRRKNEQHIYIDSVILYGYLDKEDEIHTECTSILHKIKNSMRHNSQIRLYVPLLVLAEVISRAIEEEPAKRRQLLEKLANFHEEFKIEKIWIDRNCIKLTNNILNIDNRIEPSDALILGIALNDPHATKLITFDTKMLKSTKLKDFIKETGSNLKITAEF